MKKLLKKKHDIEKEWKDMKPSSNHHEVGAFVKVIIKLNLYYKIFFHKILVYEKITYVQVNLSQ